MHTEKSLTIVGRRRLVLTEKFVNNTKRGLIIPAIFNSEVFLKDKFKVELEKGNGDIVDPKRIRGFKIENVSGKGMFRVTTLLHIKEWISDYEKVVVARIFLYDAIGNEIGMLDLDVLFCGYAFECDYGSNESMMPCFYYRIIE